MTDASLIQGSRALNQIYQVASLNSVNIISNPDSLDTIAKQVSVLKAFTPGAYGSGINNLARMALKMQLNLTFDVIRGAVVDALGAIGNHEDVPGLMAAFEKEPSIIAKGSPMEELAIIPGVPLSIYLAVTCIVQRCKNPEELGKIRGTIQTSEIPGPVKNDLLLIANARINNVDAERLEHKRNIRNPKGNEPMKAAAQKAQSFTGFSPPVWSLPAKPTTNPGKIKA